MVGIDVDFEVYKKLTNLRKSEDHSFNDVLREMVELPAIQKPAGEEVNKPWISMGVIFPHGTQFRGRRKGKEYAAKIDNGELMVSGRKCDGLSPAVKIATGKGENGWKFWFCKRPGDVDWIVADQLRPK